jgi:predicted enzyme related to lactoylglutathione lyase
MAHPVVHFEIIGKDAAALRTFYAAAFGWDVGPPNPELGGYALIQPQAPGHIGGGIGGGVEGYDGHVTVYVAVDDIEAALAKVGDLGGKRLMGPNDLPDGARFAMFADPEGHVIGLVQGPA